MVIIGVSGKAESGKTYTCKLFEKLYSNRKVEIVPLARTLKQYAEKLGWDGEKDEKGRSLLQQLGPVMKNYHGDDCFARWAYEYAVENKLDVMLVDDVRLLGEVNFFDTLYNLDKIDNLMFVRVERPSHENSLSPEQRKDASETELDNFEFDLVLENDGTSNYDDFIKELYDLGVI